MVSQSWWLRITRVNVFPFESSGEHRSSPILLFERTSRDLRPARIFCDSGADCCVDDHQPDP